MADWCREGHRAMDETGLANKAELILNEILASESLRPAAEARAQAEQEMEGLRAAQAALMRRARELVTAHAAAAAHADEAVVAAARGGWRSGAWRSAVAKLRAVEEEQFAATRGNRKLLEEMLPAAEAGLLEARAEELEAQGIAVRQAAAERMQKTAELMAGAAAHEGGIVFDPRSTLSGFLEARAERLFGEADELRRQARERRERHAAMLRGAGGVR